MSPFRSLRFAVLFAAIAATLNCGSGDGLTVPSEGLPSEITVLSGNGQAGTVGQPLGDSLVVRLTDSKDRPVKGQRIHFNVMAGGSGATLVPDTATTDNDGAARAQWVLGEVAGPQEVEAKVVSPVLHGSLKASFTATASAQGPDTLFAVAGEDQTGIVNGLLGDSLVVVVADVFGNPLTGQMVTWLVPAGQGSVSAPSSITGDDGRAAVARILGPNSGAQSARATSGATGQVVVFRHTAVSGHAVNIVMLSPDGQTAPAGSRLADSLVVQAQDDEGNGVPGELITWVTTIGGVATPTLSTTDAEGKAFTYWTLSGAPGSNTLTAAGFGTSVQYHATGISRDPDSLRALSPTSFSATAGQPVAPGQRPSVRVSDAQGNAVQGVSVTFTVTGGGGTISDANGAGTSVAIATDANGSATLTSWTLGPSLGANSVTAGASRSGGTPLVGSPVSFTATAQAGTAAHLVFGHQPGNAVAGATIAPAVTVVVQDQNGNPVTGSSTMVSLTFGNNPGSGNLSGTTTATPVNGVVTFANLSIDKAGSGYTLMAHASGLADISSTPFDVTPGTANRLAFLTGPSDVGAGATMAPAIRIVVQDLLGNTVVGSTTSIALTLGSNPGGGTLNGGGPVAVVNGVATFNSVAIDRPGNGYSLVADDGAGGAAPITSTTFNVQQGAATHLAFLSQPGDLLAGAKIAPPLQVAIQDGSGNTVTTANDSITLSLNPASGGLGGVTATHAVNGIATFDQVTVAAAGTGYTITAFAPLSPLVSATSNSFNVTQTAPPVLHLVFTVQPSDTKRGDQMRPKVLVSILDQNNQVYTQATAPVTVALGNNPLGLATLHGALTQTPRDGVAEFGNLSVTGLNLFSNLTLIASSPGMTSVESTSFDVQ